MSDRDVPSIDEIVKADLCKTRGRREKHLGAIHKAAEKGLKHILSSAQESDATIRGYTDISQDHYQGQAETAADHAVKHLEDYLMDHYLDGSFKKGANTQEIKDLMYSTIFGEKARIQTPNGEQEIKVGPDYFKLIFQNIFATATSDREVSSRLHGELERSGVEEQTDIKSTFDFGKSIKPGERMKDLIIYTGLDKIVDAERATSMQDYQALLGLARQKGSNPAGYDVEQVRKAIASKTPHILTDSAHKKAREDKIIQYDFKKAA